jgi:poly(3-hydroxybutyrate) depolymerase
MQTLWSARAARWTCLVAMQWSCLSSLDAPVFAMAARIEHTLWHDGLERWFVESTFDSFQAGRPVVIALHGEMGSGSGGGGMYDLLNHPSTLEALAQKNGFMILAPQAVDITTLNTKSGTMALWNCGWQVASTTQQPNNSAISLQVDDVGYLQALAEWAIVERQADPLRIYLLGHSSGGSMVYKALVEQPVPPIYAAATALAAPMVVYPNPALKKQPNGTTTPLFIMMGTRDKVVPYEGGALTVGTSGGSDSALNINIAMSALQAKQWWIDANSANVSAVQTTRLPNRKWRDGCRIHGELYPPTWSIDAETGQPSIGAPVAFMTMQGGGHLYATTVVHKSCWKWGLGHCRQWKRAWGPICVEVEALELAWSFMASFTLLVF